MAVYPVCVECGIRREKCTEQTAHKRAVRWTADVQFTRTSPRLRKTYDSKELADVQERQWHTDYERGQLLPHGKTRIKTFDEIADEWSVMIVGQNRIANFNRGERYRVEKLKARFGKYITKPVIDKDGKPKLVLLTFDDGEEWINERLAKGNMVGTVNRDMKPLKWIMAYALKKGYIDINPISELKELKGANIRVRWMSEAEIKLLVDAAYKMEDYDLIDIIDVGLNTGFRKGNLERLCARDISDNRITAVKTKSGKPYDVPVSPALAARLAQLVNKKPTGPILHTVNLDWRFRDAARLAGLYKDEKDPEKVTIHTMRHTFAALYLKRGGDLFKLSKLLGHANSRITESTYAHICPKDMDAQAPLISTTVHREVSLRLA